MIHLDTKSGGLAGFMREDSWAPRVADSSAAGACRVFVAMACREGVSVVVVLSNAEDSGVYRGRWECYRGVPAKPSMSMRYGLGGKKIKSVRIGLIVP